MHFTKKTTSEKNFEIIGKKIGFDSLKKFKPYIRYSEHPFVEADIDGVGVNVVPCYDIKKGEWKSAADRSTFHTEFMSEKLTGSMKDDIRILKCFLKINGMYGAEIAKQGFSGYVCEVLVYYLGSFENVLKKNFSICWRWFYRMQIPMIIGYHDMFEDLTTFHVWGTVCMNQAFNYKTALDKRNGSNQTHDYMDFQKELFTGDYNKFNESIILGEKAKSNGVSAMSVSDMTGTVSYTHLTLPTSDLV